MLRFSPEGRLCSFCGAVGGSQSRFAGGYGALICADCVHRYHGSLQDEPLPGEVVRPNWEAMPTVDLLAHLATIVATEQQVHAFMLDWVRLLRLRRATWSTIGEALGMSRQAAWERFTRHR